MPRKFVFRLSPEKRERLQDPANKGKTRACRIVHAQVLLQRVLQSTQTGPSMVRREKARNFSG